MLVRRSALALVAIASPVFAIASGPSIGLTHGRTFRIGYRVDRIGSILASVELPIDVLEQEIAGGLELVTTISPSGEIVSQILGSSGLTLEGAYSIISIDRLNPQTVDNNNLRLEELPASEPSGLLRSLETSKLETRHALRR